MDDSYCRPLMSITWCFLLLWASGLTHGQGMFRQHTFPKKPTVFKGQSQHCGNNKCCCAVTVLSFLPYRAMMIDPRQPAMRLKFSQRDFQSRWPDRQLAQHDLLSYAQEPYGRFRFKLHSWLVTGEHRGNHVTGPVSKLQRF